MAETKADPHPQLYKFCAKFFRKECYRGISCPYRHASVHHVELTQPLRPDYDYAIGFYRGTSRLCHYYQRGECHFGSRCRFLHQEAPPTNQQQHQTNHTRNFRNSKLQSAAWNVNQPSTSSQSSSSAGTDEGDDKDDASECSEAAGITEPSKLNKKNALDLPYTLTSGALKPEEWVNAPEFVPFRVRAKSYAQAVTAAKEPNDATDENKRRKLCPYAESDGICKYPVGECTYLHGDMCDMCGRAALHPYNEEQRKEHVQECIMQHERDMELSFAIARSKEKSCGVCFEVILEKTSGEQRFGILPNCNHCFCLSCIRKWRQARQFENKIIRACPECRVTSDFVCPSMYWVDTKEEKEKLIESYKQALSRKDCKYFKQGRGKCPFGNKCFYLHALPDGTKTDVGPPPRQRRNFCNSGEIEMLERIILWDFLEGNDHWLYALAAGVEDVVGFFSDTDDSDLSDFEFFD